MPAPGDYGIGVRDSPTGVSFTIKGRIKARTPSRACSALSCSFGRFGRSFALPSLLLFTFAHAPR